MELVRFHVHPLHLLVGYFSAGGIFPTIQATGYFQPLRRGGLGNQVHDGFVIPQRLAPPVRRNERKEPMLDLIPFAGAGWKVADGQRQPGFIRQLLQFQFPQT